MMMTTTMIEHWSAAVAAIAASVDALFHQMMSSPLSTPSRSNKAIEKPARARESEE
jgi:hypothetical protein